MRFEDNEFGPSVFKENFYENSIIIGAFLDDLVIMSGNLATNQEIVNKLRESFEITMLIETNGDSTLIDVLGIQVTEYWKKIFTVSCSKYIHDVIKRWEGRDSEKPRESKLFLPGVENF